MSRIRVRRTTVRKVGVETREDSGCGNIKPEFKCLKDCQVRK